MPADKTASDTIQIPAEKNSTTVKDRPVVAKISTILKLQYYPF